MLRFDVNISFLLKEVPFLERFERAASLGFGAVEFPWPGDENLPAIEVRVRETGLKVVLIISMQATWPVEKGDFSMTAVEKHGYILVLRQR